MTEATQHERPFSIRWKGQRPLVELAARRARVRLSEFVRQAALRAAIEELGEAITAAPKSREIGDNLPGTP